MQVFKDEPYLRALLEFFSGQAHAALELLQVSLFHRNKIFGHEGRWGNNGFWMEGFLGFGKQLDLHLGVNGTAKAAMRVETVVVTLTEKRNVGPVDVFELSLIHI